MVGETILLVKYQGYVFVVDKGIDFIMLHRCYLNGCNCYNCFERVIDGCIVDEIYPEDLVLEGKEV